MYAVRSSDRACAAASDGVAAATSGSLPVLGNVLHFRRISSEAGGLVGYDGLEMAISLIRRVLSRRVLLLYVLLMLLAGAGYALYDSYQLDGDALSFMDIGDALLRHDWPRVVNAYWNPLYAGALAVGQAVARPSRWDELQVFYWVNFVIFAAAIGACLFFVRSMTLLRAKAFVQDGERSVFSARAMQFVSLALLFFSYQRELSLGKVRSDALLLVFLLLAGGMFFRVQRRAWGWFPLLGATLGLAYLTKSFAFLPTAALLGGTAVYGILRQRGQDRQRTVVGAMVAGVCFLAVAGPYIAAISKRQGHLTTGDSGPMNYAFDVDGTVRFHAFNHPGEGAGRARVNFRHHEQLLLADPPVYSYAPHAWGTVPLWFDPAYWDNRIVPRFYLQGQIERLERSVVQLVRFLVAHPEGLVVVLVLLAAGCGFRQPWREMRLLLPILGWGLLMFAIYMPVDLQDRYLTGAFLLVLLPGMALLRRPQKGGLGRTPAIMAVLLALLALADAARDLGERRRTLIVTGYPRGAYSMETYPAADGLAKLGVKPGDRLACLGDQACYPDPYWVRLAGAQLFAQVDTLNRDPAALWRGYPNKQQIVERLRGQGVKVLVAMFGPATRQPEGWVQLGSSNLYGLPLDDAGAQAATGQVAKGDRASDAPQRSEPLCE